MKWYTKNTPKVQEQLKKGEIDRISFALGGFTDEVLKEMFQLGIIDLFVESFPDKRAGNSIIPPQTLLVLATAAKMKRMCAVTDIPHAVTSPELLDKLEYNLCEIKDENSDLMTEGTIRAYIDKYTPEELMESYNRLAREVIRHMGVDVEPSIHQHDATNLEVSLQNSNYEQSEVTKGKKGEPVRGYKLNTSRLMLEQGGLIERVSLSSIKTHDLEASRKMLEDPIHIKESDTLVYDRGYLDREIINTLKREKAITVVVPVKKNMLIFKESMDLAISQNDWHVHPNTKRKGQEIKLIKDMGTLWESEAIGDKKPVKIKEEDVALNTCVIRIDKKKEKSGSAIEDDICQEEKGYQYIVLATSDTTLTGAQIIRTYETRPEIEEDYRQLKDVWGLDNFTSTKYKNIVFHIVMMLVAYLFYQVYKNTKAGAKYGNKSLATILDTYELSNTNDVKINKVTIYYKNMFGIIDFVDLLDIYAECGEDVRAKIKAVIKRPAFYRH